MKTKNTQKQHKNKNHNKNSISTSRRLTEIVLTSATARSVYNCTSDAGGNASGAVYFTPLGLVGAGISGSAFVNAVVVDNPRLLQLSALASDYQQYRVVNASIMFKGNLGSTTSGRIAIQTSSDPDDINAGMNFAYAIDNHSKTFDLAMSQNRDFKVEMPVDTSWKIVSNVLSCTPSACTWTTTNGTSVPIPMNTVKSLGFGGFAFIVSGAPASVILGNFYLDYSVEFRYPISLGNNL